MATYAVGDIQGCYQSLQRLLEQVNFDPAADRLWAVGDLVNRGPESLNVLRFLKSLGSQFSAVLGNHDLHLLALSEGIKNPAKAPTLQQVLEAPDCAELLGWLKQWPLVHFETVNQCDYLMVHAGIPQKWSIEQVLQRAEEVATVLRGENRVRFLREMYGDFPDQWYSGIEGYDRLRLITNSLTRMRFTNAEGVLELTTKTGPETAPSGYQPWFSYPRQPDEYTHILFGHWAALDGNTGGASMNSRIHALDTGCVWGKTLTMMRLEDRQLFSTDCVESR